MRARIPAIVVFIPPLRHPSPGRLRPAEFHDILNIYDECSSVGAAGVPYPERLRSGSGHWPARHARHSSSTPQPPAPRGVSA